MDDEYKFERVEDKRFLDGRLEYFLKKEPPDPAEPQEPQLALEPEKRVEQVPSPESQPIMFFGFERGLVPVKILGATEVRQKYMFLIRWEGSDRADLVLASEANERCPQVVINFYVERIVYGDPMGASGSGTRSPRHSHEGDTMEVDEIGEADD